jgi:hypothetical protein
MRFKSLIAGCIGLFIFGYSTPAESRVLPRCFHPVCLFAAALIEQLVECMFKGGCWQSEKPAVAPSVVTPPEQSQSVASGRPAPARKKAPLLLCREALVCSVPWRHWDEEICFWREECRRAR